MRKLKISMKIFISYKFIEDKIVYINVIYKKHNAYICDNIQCYV